MRWRALAATAVLLPSVAFAQTVEQRLDNLEQENAELRQELRDLRARSNGNTATSQPAAPSPVATMPVGEPGQPANEPGGSLRTPPPAERWQVGLRPNGGGFYFTSPDQNFTFSLLGFAQAQGELTDLTRPFSFGNGDFSIFRARIDFLAEFYKRFQLTIEPDFATKGGTSLAEAKLNTKIIDDWLQLRAGKFVTPFSTENFRSARALDTVQRFIALKSMFTLPALDFQTGVMLWGNVGLGPPVAPGQFRPNFSYYVGVYNGNSSLGNEVSGLGGTARDSNNDKEIQAKVVCQPIKPFSLGVGFDHNVAEANEMFSLTDLAGAVFIKVPAGGARNGVDGDFFWERNKLSFRGEALLMPFDDARFRLWGGFVQAAYFLVGDYSKGLQLLVRPEYAKIEGRAVSHIPGNSITAITFGANWFINGNARLQVDYSPELFDGAGNTGSVLSRSVRNTLYAQLQFKF